MNSPYLFQTMLLYWEKHQHSCERLLDFPCWKPQMVNSHFNISMNSLKFDKMLKYLEASHEVIIILLIHDYQTDVPQSFIFIPLI